MQLRRSLIFGESRTCNEFGDPTEEDQDNECEPDFENFEQGGLQHDSYMDTEVPLPNEKVNGVLFGFNHLYMYQKLIYIRS